MSSNDTGISNDGKQSNLDNSTLKKSSIVKNNVMMITQSKKSAIVKK